MNYDKLIKEEMSGNIAKSYVAQITRFNRIQASTMFHEAAEYIKTELQQLGLDDIAIEQYTADGAHKYWTHTSPMGWTVRNAELRLVEPEEQLLCSYKDIPQSLHMHSNATPPGGVTGEVVDVGAGTKPSDYEGRKIKGKIVLASGRARIVHEQAVYKYDAAGVLTDIPIEIPNVREAIDIPDAHAYQAIWPTAEQLPKVTFGFSLSKRQGNQLRNLLKNGKKVKVKATVDARLFPGKLDVVTATIRGKSKEEVFLVAHMCHPKQSANDNASGSGTLLEIARTIKALINARKIPILKRTIRFLWVPETYGSVAYLSSHEDASKRLVAGINLDMVGQNQELCKSTLNLDRTPESLPSYLNDFVYSLVEQSKQEFDSQTYFGSAGTFRTATTAFSGGSDHSEFTEATVHVPCIMLLQWPDLYYHTSMDTLDKVSEDSLKRIGWISAVAALTLANADDRTAFRLATETAANATMRIAESILVATRDLNSKLERPKKRTRQQLAAEIAQTAHYHVSILDLIAQREQEAVNSVKRLASSKELDTHAKESDRQILQVVQAGKSTIEKTAAYLAKTIKLKIPKIKETREETKAKSVIPIRTYKGTLNMDLVKKAIGEKEYEWYEKIEEQDRAFKKKMPEILNFMDGKRTLLSIIQAVSAEYGPTDIKHVVKCLQDLQKCKLVKTKAKLPESSSG